MLEEALMESTPMPVDVLKVEQMGGGAAEVSPVDVVIAWTLEPELLASSTIEGSAPEGVPVMEEVCSAPVGSKPMVTTANP